MFIIYIISTNPTQNWNLKLHPHWLTLSAHCLDKSLNTISSLHLFALFGYENPIPCVTTNQKNTTKIYLLYAKLQICAQWRQIQIRSILDTAIVHATKKTKPYWKHHLPKLDLTPTSCRNNALKSTTFKLWKKIMKQTFNCEDCKSLKLQI